MKRIRTKHFVISGAIGGFAGFLLMEVLRLIFPGGGSRLGEIVALAFQFAGFGLAVGAALGLTEGLVQRKWWRLLYGLVLGLLLGGAGGCAGGAVGQAIFGLLPSPPVPERPGTDIAITLDSSGSMKEFFFFGSDPDGKRKEAARKLLGLLGPRDRVAIIGFNHASTVLFPLTAIDSKVVRKKARQAIRRIGNSGGTSLDAGLGASLTELAGKIADGRRQHVIFLTDGVGGFHEATLRPALESGIKVYTIGLGSGVDRRLLTAIAERTDGRYFPVDHAGDLWKTFETIYRENIGGDMASRQDTGQGGADPFLVLLFRVLSWGAMGLLIGCGQGVRENTREDLRACALGGLAGGLAGGACFNPVSGLVQAGSGVVGRLLGDVVVGACIGGSLRLAQKHLVEFRGKPTTTLLEILPEKSTALVEMPGPSPPPPPPARLVEKKGLKGLVLQVKHNVEGRIPGPEPATTAAPATPATPAAPPAISPAFEELSRPRPAGRRKPLSFYQNRYPGDRTLAMAKAFRSGHYSIEDVAEHFRVQRGRVVRAIRQHQG